MRNARPVSGEHGDVPALRDPVGLRGSPHHRAPAPGQPRDRERMADTYSDEDVLFFSLVADQIALATDDALNFEASQKTASACNCCWTVESGDGQSGAARVLKEISASIRHVMQCDGVGVILPANEENQFRLFALDFPKSKGMLADKLSMPVEEKASLTACSNARAVRDE